MLSAADAILVRRDPRLSELPRLLDAEAFAQTLARAYPQAAVSGVASRYIRYKPGTSCLVGYAVRCGAGEVWVYARAHAPGHDQKLEKAAQRESVSSALGDGIRLLPEQGLVIYPFPNDHELGALQWLSPQPHRAEMLEQVLPERRDLWHGQLSPLRYKPERRFVARLAGPEGAVVLKVYAKQEYNACKDNQGRFSGVNGLRVPRCLTRCRGHHLAAIEWLEGNTLHEAMAGPAADAIGWPAVGAALAALHAQQPRKIHASWTAERYAQVLAEAAASLAELVPDLGERARRLAERVGAALLDCAWRADRAIHGDFSTDQVLLHDGTVGIVDFDRAAWGDPRMDLGSFRAKLEYDVLEGAVAAPRAASCFAAVLDAYRSAQAGDAAGNLDRFVAAALLQLAVQPFRDRREDWAQRMEAILAKAEGYGDGLGH